MKGNFKRARCTGKEKGTTQTETYMTGTFVRTRLMAKVDFIRQQTIYGSKEPGTWVKQKK
jgi:hypothetical protein